MKEILLLGGSTQKIPAIHSVDRFASMAKL